VGEHSPPREVFPLDWSASRIHPRPRTRLARGEHTTELQVVAEVSAVVLGRRSVRPPLAKLAHRTGSRDADLSS
jgi:hypothetical protein